MYDITQSQSIRRSDLTEASSREPSLDIESLERLRALSRFEYTETTEDKPTDEARSTDDDHAVTNDNDEHDDDDTGMEFRLFGPSDAKSTGPIQVIRLRSPTPAEEILATFQARPDSYYRARPVDAKLADEYKAAALSGQQVKHHATIKAWQRGCSYPWKIITISSKDARTALARDSAGGSAGVVGKRTRTRIGKKARIKRRTAAVEAETRREEAVRAEADRERHLREKKARKNREKKVKKRARDKLKRLDDGSLDAAGDPDGHDGDSSDGDST